MNNSRSARVLIGTCLAMAAGASGQDVQVVLREGQAVPGAAGVIDFINKVEINNAGQVVVTASTDAVADDFVIVATHSPFAITQIIAEGSAVAGEPGLVHGRITSQVVDINAAGQFVFINETPAGLATVYRDGVKSIREGELVGVDVINDIDQAQIDGLGGVWCLADIGDNVDLDDTLLHNGVVVLREGSTVDGIPILGISRSESTSGAKLNVNDAGDYIVEIDRDNSDNSFTFPDKNVIVNGVSVLAEGEFDPLIGGGTGGEHNFFHAIGLTESGDWFAISIYCTLDGCDVVEALIREGVILAETFDDLGGGLSIDRFQIADMNSRGDWIASVDVFGAPDTSTDEALLINGQMVLREGDPVPGEPGFVWIGGFGQVRDMAIDDSGRYVFASGMRPAAGGDTLDILVTGSVGAACLCEVDGDANQVDVFDLLAYLDLWFVADPAADLDGAAGVDVFDLLAFLDCWFVASAGGCA